MDLKLTGKTVVVTGATRGIGRAIAEQFAAEGANVAICARDDKQVADMVERLRAQNVHAFGSAFDVADPDALQAFVHGAASELGGIDMFVANASSLVEGNGEAEWRRAFESDLLGAVRIAAVAGPYLEAAAARNGDASFVAISSIAASEVGAPSAYSGIKAALTNVTKGYAREYAPKKVRFNSISPGLIYAEQGSLERMKSQSPDYFNAMLGLIPVGRMGMPEEVAVAVLFLSSPLSGFTTGANLVIDGSMSTRVNF